MSDFTVEKIAKRIWEHCEVYDWGNGKSMLCLLDFERIIREELNEESGTMSFSGWFAVFNPDGKLSAVVSDLRDAVWYITRTALKGQEDLWEWKIVDLTLSNFRVEGHALENARAVESDSSAG